MYVRLETENEMEERRKLLQAAHNESEDEDEAARGAAHIATVDAHPTCYSQCFIH